MGKTVYVLQNGKSLDASEFSGYIERKVFYTIRKFRMLPHNCRFAIKGDNKGIMQFILQKRVINGKGREKRILLTECIDAAAEKLLQDLFKGKAKKISPTDKKTARPFYFLSAKELEIYASLKGLKYDKPALSDAGKMLDELEKSHKEIKYAIVKAALQTDESA